MPPSVSIVVPARNEVETIRPIVARMPVFPGTSEIVFIDGNSSDGTYEAMAAAQKEFPDRRITILKQKNKGKAGAVFEGIAAARSDIVIVYDSDMTVPIEDLPRFYETLGSGAARFANGSRLRRRMEKGAMPALNYAANFAFALVFSALFRRRLTDTLCGTKAFWRTDFARMKNAMPDLRDPFGDFYFLLGAHELGLAIAELPVSYKARVYGRTKINRFKNGIELVAILCRYALFKLRPPAS